MKSKILIVGSINQDIIFHKPIKNTVIGTVFSEYSMSNGGKGVNQATAAVKLGADTTLLGCVGNDAYGANQISALKKLGINTDYIRIESEAQTGVSYLAIKEDGTYYSDNVIGANAKLTGNHVKNALEKGRFDMIIMQIEMPIETVYETYEYAKKKDIPVILDPGPAEKIDLKPLSGIYMISPNEDETFALTGIRPETEKLAKDAAVSIQKQSLTKYVVLKLGAKGAYLLEGDRGELIEAFKVNAVDSTGAGDTFTAALGISLCKNKDIREAVRWANAAGAICVSRKGGQLSVPDINEVDEFLAKNR